MDFPDLSDILTTGEAMEILGYANRSAFNQPRLGFAARYRLIRVKVSPTQYGWYAAEVLAAGRRMLKGRFRGNLRREAFEARWRTVRSRVRASRRGPLSDWIGQEEAAAILDRTRERLYQISDFRGGKVKTVRFGRIRLFLASSVREAADVRVI